MKSKYTTVEFPVFCDYIMHIEITTNLKESMLKYEYTKDLGIDLTDTHAIAVHVEDTGVSMIFLPYNASVGTIAHESYHAVRRMLKYVGAKMDNETVAHHLGYLTQKIFNFMRGKRV